MKNGSKIKKSTIKKILTYIKGYKLLFLASLIMGAVSVAMSLYIPFLIGDAIDSGCVSPCGDQRYCRLTAAF